MNNIKKDFTKIIYPDLSYKINGILFAVHNELGRFYNEKQYSDRIEFYLKKFTIKYEREKILPPSFENELEGRNKIDFLDDYFQVRRYLKALNKKLGIVVNFHQRYIRPQRILNSSVKE